MRFLRRSLIFPQKQNMDIYQDWFIYGINILRFELFTDISFRVVALCSFTIFSK